MGGVTLDGQDELAGLLGEIAARREGRAGGGGGGGGGGEDFISGRWDDPNSAPRRTVRMPRFTTPIASLDTTWGVPTSSAEGGSPSLAPPPPPSAASPSQPGTVTMSVDQLKSLLATTSVAAAEAAARAVMEQGAGSSAGTSKPRRRRVKKDKAQQQLPEWTGLPPNSLVASPRRVGEHASSSAPGPHAPRESVPTGRAICRLYHGAGRCRFGDACRFLHEPAEGDHPTGSKYTSATTLADLRGKVASAAFDRHASRVLQRILHDAAAAEEQGEADVDEIFVELFPSVWPRLCVDPIGHYLAQELISSCTRVQRGRLLLALLETETLPALCVHPQGTRVVQRLVACGPRDGLEHLDNLKTGLAPAIPRLLSCPHGHHVLLACLLHVPGTALGFLFMGAARCLPEAGCDRHGALILQRCLDVAEGRERATIVSEVCDHALVLSRDPYGNFLVQHVLSEDGAAVRICRNLLSSVSELALDKHASRVLEKCLAAAPPDTQEDMVKGVLFAEGVARTLLRDPYGNYVLQRALKLSRGAVRHKALVEIAPLLSELDATPFGRRIRGKILKRVARDHRRTTLRSGGDDG